MPPLYGGGNWGNMGGVVAEDNRGTAIPRRRVTLPPLVALLSVRAGSQ